MMSPGDVHAERRLERHSGLPIEVSSLVGRGLQIAAVLDGLRAVRVLTLTGPGGCGKTRLALRAATLAADRFEDGARLVELASLTGSALVTASVAEALGIPEQDAADPMAAVVRALSDRELLIVLDNCEHVLESASQVVVMLAEQCRRVRVMATSRERLDVPGESVFPVPPLELPDDGSVRAVAGSEAGHLFITRARAANPAFAPERGQLGRDRRGVCPAGRHAAGHRVGCGPVPGARARAARRPPGGPPGPAVRRRRPPGAAPLPGSGGVVEL
jgi:non-specific serine/threonine protein kinase